MNFFRKLFRITAKPQPDVTPPDASEPSLIRVRNAEGDEFHVTRQEWFDKVLAGRFQDSWDDPEQLAVYLAQTISDDFFDESIPAAERLLTLDDSSRSSGLLARTYLGAGRMDDAERIVRDSLSRHGKNGITLTNLAHVQANRGEYDTATATLWQALEADPNYERAVCWYESVHREQGGEAVGIAALSRLAALPGSWRPQLMLGQHALHSQQPDRAFALFRECIDRVVRPAPMDVLADISAALGSAGHFPEIGEIVEPAFEPAVHGMHVGSNLMRAHAEMGEFDKARKILDQLYAVRRPEAEAQLKYWTDVLATAEAS